MKQKSLFIKLIFSVFYIFLFISFSSCTKTGEGEIKQKDIPLTKDINGIIANGSFRVILMPDENNPRMTIETYENLSDNINVHLSKNTLRIKESSPVSEDTEIYIVKIYLSSINNIELYKKIQMDINSQFRSEQLSIKLNDLTKLIGNDIISSNVTLRARNKAKINLNGSTSHMKMQLYDDAKFSGRFFEISELDCYMKGISLAEINVKNKLNGVIEDNTKLLYLGNPSKDIKQKDMSKLNQENEEI